MQNKFIKDNRNISEAIHLRFANRDDIPLILQFIKELAEYENLAQEVVATETILEDSLFGKKAYAEVILAYQGNRPAGFALFFLTFPPLQEGLEFT